MSGSKLIVDSALRAASHLHSSKIPTEVAKSSAALFSAYGGAKHSLPDLPYDYGALAREYDIFDGCYAARYETLNCCFSLSFLVLQLPFPPRL